MSVQIIDGGDVAALYCDTDGEAFGPTFKSVEHAQDFCRWLREAYYGPDRSRGWFHSPDPRRYQRADLQQHHSLWRSERIDDETGELLEVPVAS